MLPCTACCWWQYIGTLLYTLITITLLYLGWQNRDFSYLNAEYGTGYALGIIGGVMMLLLYLYPARKQWRPMRRMGPVKYWFRMHMILGVVGPVTVIFHSNFRLGSLNSSVAMTVEKPSGGAPGCSWRSRIVRCGNSGSSRPAPSPKQQ